MSAPKGSPSDHAAPSGDQTADRDAKGKFAPGNKLGNRFQPGQSGNPDGRPKGPTPTPALRKLMRMDPERAANFKPRNGAEAIAHAWYLQQIHHGKHFAFAVKEALDRTEGRVPAAELEADQQHEETVIVVRSRGRAPKTQTTGDRDDGAGEAE